MSDETKVYVTTNYATWNFFRPHSNINVYELAQILEVAGFGLNQKDLDSLPKYAKRHFVDASKTPTGDSTK